MSVCFKLPEIGPAWYSLILCPKCNTVIKSTDDMKNDSGESVYSEELICPVCGEAFTFILNEQEEYPRIQVRPVPQSMMNYTLGRDGGFGISGNDRLRSFLYAFMAWKNFVDSKGQPVKLTEKLKEEIFQKSGWEIPSFVQIKSQFLQNKKVDQEKN